MKSTPALKTNKYGTWQTRFHIFKLAVELFNNFFYYTSIVLRLQVQHCTRNVSEPENGKNILKIFYNFSQKRREMFHKKRRDKKKMFRGK